MGRLYSMSACVPEMGRAAAPDGFQRLLRVKSNLGEHLVKT